MVLTISFRINRLENDNYNVCDRAQLGQFFRSTLKKKTTKNECIAFNRSFKHITKVSNWSYCMELYLEVVKAVKSQLNVETVKNRRAFSGRVGKHENSVRIVLKCYVCKKTY